MPRRVSGLTRFLARDLTASDFSSSCQVGSALYTSGQTRKALLYADNGCLPTKTLHPGTGTVLAKLSPYRAAHDMGSPSWAALYGLSFANKLGGAGR